MADDKISIAGLDKADVLRCLYDRARPLGLGFLNYTPEPMTHDEAAAIFKAYTEHFPTYIHFDYVKGRVMKVNLTGDEFDPWGYDRDNGEGAAAAVIAALRSGLRGK